MSKEINILPELRFPEFVNLAGWEKKEFGELLSFLSDYTANGSFASLKENVQYYTSEEYAVLVRTTDLEKKKFAPARFTDKRGYEFLSKTSLFGDEIIMANVGSIGKVYKAPFYDKPMTLAPNTYVLKFKENVDEEFIYQLMLRTEFEHKLLSMVGSSTLKAINKKNLRSIEITIPKKPEQQKIASCLSSLDELLIVHNDKLDALKDHKTGLMQNLFPQEGETVPKFRFKEFKDDGEWELKPFSKYIKLYRGSSPRPISKFQTQDENGVNWIKIGDTSSINDFIIRTVSEKITPEGAEKSRKVKKGELILANSMSYGKTYQLALDGCIYDGWFVLREYEKIFDKQFLLQLLNSNYQQEQYKKLAAGGIVQNISSEIVYSTLLPKTSKEEQQKIASCLSALDELINAQTDKIEQLKQHKKGLMQGLFPKIES